MTCVFYRHQNSCLIVIFDMKIRFIFCICLNRTKRLHIWRIYRRSLKHRQCVKFYASFDIRRISDPILDDIRNVPFKPMWHCICWRIGVWFLFSVRIRNRQHTSAFACVFGIQCIPCILTGFVPTFSCKLSAIHRHFITLAHKITHFNTCRNYLTF